MNSYTIYLITNICNLKVYVGVTSRSIAKRFREHIKDAQNRPNGIYLRNAIRKYGVENFKIEVLCIAFDEKVAFNREKRYILLFKSYLPEKGYNSTYGGENIHLTPEIIIKRANSNRGKKRSMEVKQKMSIAAKNRRYTPEGKKKISERQKRVMQQNPDLREKIRNKIKLLWRNSEYRQRMAEARKDYYQTVKGIGNPMSSENRKKRMKLEK